MPWFEMGVRKDANYEMAERDANTSPLLVDMGQSVPNETFLHVRHLVLVTLYNRDPVNALV